MTKVGDPVESHRELERDAMAIFQVADDLYTKKRYHLIEHPGPPVFPGPGMRN